MDNHFITGDKHASILKVFCEVEPYYKIIDKTVIPFDVYYETCLKDARAVYKILRSRRLYARRKY